MRTVVLALLLALAGTVRAQENNRAFTTPVQANRSYLGVTVTDLEPGRAQSLKLDSEHGVEIVHVNDGSPAEKAGFKLHDVLLAYNGETILGAQQLGRLVSETPPGRHVKIQYLRDGKTSIAMAVTGTPPVEMTPVDPPGSWGPDFMGMIDVPSPLIAWRNLLLGIECEPLNAQLAEYFGVKQGVLVRAVEKGSPGDKAGLRPGDVVTDVAGRGLASPRDLSGCLRQQGEAGKAVLVSVMRNRKRVILNVTLPNSE